MRARFPEKLEFLFHPKRYKIAYGGRGAAKSWGFARGLLIQGAERPLRILCGRETQKSIKESVHQLLEDQVRELDLGGHYNVEKAAIYGRNGSSFAFAGLRHNVDNIKSLEGYDIVWVEEAQSVSKDSWDKLIPTIRKDGSEIWVSFNPDLATDDTYKRFVIRPPRDSVVVRINWRDNPWFPPVLRAEMEELKERDPDSYEHIWEGSCISILEGAIYAHELRKVDQENRITRVPYDASKPVDTFWDLGWGDNTSIWFAQAFAFEYRLIDALQNRQRALPWYLQQLQSRGYVYGTHYLPHDAQAHQLGSGKSIEELMRAAGLQVRIVPKLSVADGINAARTVFGQCYFDAEKCADGIQALRHYRYGEIVTLGVPTREPLHDEHSHYADAFRMFAVKAQPPKKEETPPPRRPSGRSLQYTPFG